MCACPFLGLYDDATIMLSEVTSAHRCYATKPPSAPDESHQAGTCLTDGFVSCPYYLAAKPTAGVSRVGAPAQSGGRRSSRGALIVAATVTLAALIAVAFFAANDSFGILPRPTPTLAEVVMLPTATVTPPPTEAEPTATEAPTPLPELQLPSPTPSPTRPAQLAAVTPTRAASDGAQSDAALPVETQEYRIVPVGGGAGWWDSSENVQIGLNDSFLYAGVYGNESLISAVKFDLGRIARGAPIVSGELQLSGISRDRLNQEADGIWRVQLIPQNELANLVGSDFMMLYSAAAPITLRELRTDDLVDSATNAWTLDPETLRWLETQLINGADSVIVRITASTNGTGDTLYAWDSGLGPKTEGNSPALVLNVGPPPPTPPPLPTYEYLVATFTPVPENVLTVVALQNTATAVAESVGTYTPVPPFVTPTTLPANLATAQVNAQLAGLPAIVVETPVPQNEATVTAQAEYATAVAVTTGTFTPVPTAYVTPFVIPPSPPAENSLTAVARLAEATAIAQAGGETATPIPYNAVVGEWVIATPTPQNVATAAALAIAATANAQILGPATATPFHWLMITPTPAPLPTSTPTTPPLILSSDFTPTPIPTATEFIPAALPNEYKNLVFFKRGTGPGAQTWIYNPATQETGLITRDWIYPLARQNLTLSPDGQQEAFVKRDSNGVAQIHVRTVGSPRDTQLTAFTRDSYDPAWSPTGEWIAFVSANSGNDEIYRMTTDGSVVQQLTNNQWQWDKHPSWSPDGSQIVFFSNRDVGRPQIWIMNADGSGQKNLVSSEFEDLYPVWTR